MIKKDETDFIVKSNSMFLFLSIGTFVFFIGGITMTLRDMVPYFNEYMPEDFIGFGFMCLWSTVALLMSLFSFCEYSKKIEINNNGIAYSTIFKKKFIEWHNIQDYGLSYSGQVRGGGNAYYLYFSNEQLELSGKYRKKIKKDTIRINVFGNDYKLAINEIIPFCNTKTTVTPFVAEDVFHLI